MRKKYGNTWWGKKWLNALNNIDYSNRLPRGRTYANKGLARKVMILRNRVTAEVSGSRPRPYKVEYTFPVFSANDKKGIIDIITSNPLHLSRLLNRDLPNELYELCNKKGIHLFPRSWRDIEGNCSCPDFAKPCKHMAAVLYKISNEIDQNPFLVFQLHDFDLFNELSNIGYTSEEHKDVKVLSTKDLSQAFSFEKKINIWDDEVYHQLDFSRIPDCKENLLTILSEKPTFYPIGDFKDILAKAYKAVSKAVSKKKSIPELDTEALNAMDSVENIEILADEEFDFVKCILRDSKGKIILNFDNETYLVEWLEKVPRSELSKFSLSLKGLYLTYQFALKLAQRSAYIPQLINVGTWIYKVRWLPAILNNTVRSVFDGVKSIVPQDILFYKSGKDILEPIDADKFPALLSLFLNYFVHTNHNLNTRFREHEIGHLFFNGAIEQFRSNEDREYPTAIQLWLHRFFMSEKDCVPVIQVDEEGEGFEVSIAVQDTTKPLEPLIPLEVLLEQDLFSDIRLDILRDLAMLADYFPQITDIVASKGRDKIYFNAQDFVNVLFKILPTIRLFGIKVLLPKALRKLMRPRMSMMLESGEESGVVKQKSMLNMDEMLSFQWQVAVGDQYVSQEEFIQMIHQYEGIVKLNDQYVFFDEKEIQTLLNKLENPPTLNPKELLQIALTEDYEGAKVSLDENTRKLIDELLNTEETLLPNGLKATLRPYQLSGYEWLYKNSRIGFGSLIADDMGLGKTLQVISTLLKLKEDGQLDKKKALVIVPTTLLTNWDKEIKRFAPDLKTHIYHGSNRQLEPLKEAEVLITTYGVVRSEGAKLQKEKWLAIVIDEAQNIKNPATAQTKAVKKLKAPIKIAMSGTPVENRLSEYWSIFDFTNKGYLDTLTKFKEDFAKPIEVDRDQEQLDKFRKITQPFILRRLKSDKSIIKDLPDKIEKDQFCQLTPMQMAIYQNVIDTTMEAIDKADGIARKGLVLKLITALKQVCNHPKHFLKKGEEDPTLSGKATLLFDLIKQIQESGEKTLIFTQYQEMGKMLVRMLEEEFNLEIAFLHGGVSRKGRDEMVEDFQNNRATRIMILSLKAGGTGLNLTAASNVIHFDLWWNPAVEAQATDRAYRIGQKNNVLVHRFITQGTFEEKINKLLQKKKELANLTVSTGEKWIGEFSNEELKELVRLE